MKTNKQLEKIINKLIDLSFKDGKIVESQVVKSVKILKSLSRSEAIGALSDYLGKLKRKEREHTLYIETAIFLSPAQVQKMKRIVDKKVKITKVLVKVSQDMLGGFKLRIGDEIWDESVSGKIDLIKEVIRKGRYE